MNTLDWMYGEFDTLDPVMISDHEILNLSSPDPHDGSPANIDPETQKHQEEIGRLDINDDDFEPAGDLDEEPEEDQ